MNKIIDIIRKLEGNLLLIGVDKKEVINAVKNNDKLLHVDNLYSLDKNNNQRSKKGFSKEINVKNFKKHFKKNKVDTIICNFKDIKSFLKDFVKDSIHIANRKIYYINYNNEDLEIIKNKYNRYNLDIEVIDNIVIIDVFGVKNNYFKDKFYYILDYFLEFIDAISDLMIK